MPLGTRPLPPTIHQPAMAADPEFFKLVASPLFCERLFAHLPGVVFCMKDSRRRYRAANRAFADRLGLASPKRLLGKQAEDFFPPELAETYRSQDEQVLSSGLELTDRLELITARSGAPGWHLATKVPVLNADGKIIGLASISRDLGAPATADPAFDEISRIVTHIQENPDAPDLSAPELAARGGMSGGKLERRMKKIFHLSVAAFVRKTRIDLAARLLAHTDTPIAEIALTCGYSEQSSFTRQFRATVGLPPAAYRTALTRRR